ncbi:hypothetical protein [Streptomyces albus]|uniref:hypothetical protein n=1 Tax=Streptomyces albus TaxID=1888 RepID=UPI0006E45E5B|nr:hypothetical protein [Streptomyces albus]
MTDAGAKDSPASLYGPVSLVLGIISLLSAVFPPGFGVALLCGSLGVTLAVMGLRTRLRRGMCLIGLVTGGIPVLFWLSLVVVASM